MQIHVWKSFSSNNSSAYRLVARFGSAEQAATAGKELEVFLARHAEEVDESGDIDNPSAAQQELAEKHSFSWPNRYPLHWGDEMLSGDEPSVAVADSTLVLYHDYCGGFEETLGEYLKAVGGELEGEEREAPTVSVWLTLPKGKAGQKMRAELEGFFDQRIESGDLDDWSEPPWPANLRLPYAEPEDVLYFSDGAIAAFHMPMNTGDLDGLKGYFAERGVDDYRLLLCDGELVERLQILSQASRCPECRASELKLLAADSEKIEEDQVLCGACGGMFTLAAIAAASPVSKVGHARISRIDGIGETFFLAALDGAIYRSREGGPIEPVKQTKVQLFGLRVLSEKTILAAGYGGKIFRSTNGGGRWSTINTGQTGYLFNISRAPGGALFVAGTSAILRSEDEGKSWSPTDVKVTGHILHVDAASDQLLFAVGHGGVILRSRDGGASWKKQRSGVKTPLCKVLALSEEQAVVIGDSGVILTTADGGTSWTKRSVKASGDFEDMARGNDGRLYAVTGGGQILVSSNGGKKWTVEPSGAACHLWSIWPSPSGTLMIVGDDGTVLRRDDLDVAREERDEAPEPEPEEAAAPAKKVAKKKVAKKKVAKKKVAKKKVAKKKVAKKASAPQAATTSADGLPTVGRSFVFTGKLSTLTRAKAKERVAELGGVSKSSVTKDLDYLVVGDEGSPLFGQGSKGSKIIAAEKLIDGGASLKIISETAFMELEKE